MVFNKPGTLVDNPFIEKNMSNCRQHSKWEHVLRVAKREAVRSVGRRRDAQTQMLDTDLDLEGRGQFFNV
jgi:hypothetical protein